MPTFAENESPNYLRFDWRSNVSNPGAVRLVETPDDKAYAGSRDMHLMDGQSDPTHGYVHMNIDSQREKVWAPEAELLFTLSQDELTIESPVLETLTKKSWSLMPAGGPGWILFKGNGNPPYRLQIGEVLYGCDGLNAADSSVSATDADWPPEAVMGREIVGAPHMGETPAQWEKQREQHIVENVRSSWLGWSIWIGIAFAAALAIALLPLRR